MSTKQVLLDNEYNYNQNSVNSHTNGDRIGTTLFRDVRTKIAVYDFSVQGGAIGAVNLKNIDGSDAVLPQNAIILDSIIDVITAPTSGGSATISLGSGQSATDIKAATAVASLNLLTRQIPLSLTEGQTNSPKRTTLEPQQKKQQQQQQKKKRKNCH